MHHFIVIYAGYTHSSYILCCVVHCHQWYSNARQFSRINAGIDVDVSGPIQFSRRFSLMVYRRDDVFNTLECKYSSIGFIVSDEVRTCVHREYCGVTKWRNFRYEGNYDLTMVSATWLDHWVIEIGRRNIEVPILNYLGKLSAHECWFVLEVKTHFYHEDFFVGFLMSRKNLTKFCSKRKKNRIWQPVSHQRKWKNPHDTLFLPTQPHFGNPNSPLQ